MNCEICGKENCWYVDWCKTTTLKPIQFTLSHMMEVLKKKQIKSA